MRPVSDSGRLSGKRQLIQNFGTYSKESPTRVEITLADRLQRVLDTSREEHSVKGISAALKIPGQETLLLTSGLSEDSIPITSDMIFNMASVTKTPYRPGVGNLPRGRRRR